MRAILLFVALLIVTSLTFAEPAKLAPSLRAACGMKAELQELHLTENECFALNRRIERECSIDVQAAEKQGTVDEAFRQIDKCSLVILNGATQGRYETLMLRELSLGSEKSAPSSPTNAGREGALLFLSAFLWLLICLGIAAITNRLLKRPAINGASVFNWLGVVLLAATVVFRPDRPDITGAYLAAYILPWLIGLWLSRDFKRKFRLAKAPNNEYPDA